MAATSAAATASWRKEETRTGEERESNYSTAGNCRQGVCFSAVPFSSSHTHTMFYPMLCAAVFER